MKDDFFAVYQGKEYTSGIDRNGKVFLRSTDIEDLDKGFEKCEPFKYEKEEKLVVCGKWVDPQEIEKYYRAYTVAHYRGFDFAVVDENEREVLILASGGDYRNWQNLEMTCIDRLVYQKWVNKSEVEMEIIEEPIKL